MARAVRDATGAKDRRVIDAATYREAAARLDRHFTISVVDCGSTVDSPVTQEVLREAHPNSHWVFRGYRPGMHVTPTHLRTHLRPVLAALEARLGTLNELTQTTPIAILAETLGYSPRTFEAHARASASTYARYVATRLD